MFLHIVGEDAVEVYNNFRFADQDKIKINMTCRFLKLTAYLREVWRVRFFTYTNDKRDV